MRFGLSVFGLLALAVLIGVLAGRSQPSTIAAPVPTAIPTPTPIPAADQVLILPASNDSSSGTYVPATLTLKVGQTVTFTNADTTDHTATADNGAFNTGVLSYGQSAQWTPKKSGRYTYSDFLHSDM